MAWNVRVQTDTEEKTNAVLDAIRPLHVEVVTGEDEIQVNELFYKARINSKLDNLGQLRHLNDIRKAFSVISSFFVGRARRDIDRATAVNGFYQAMCEIRGYTPRSLRNVTSLGNLTEEQIMHAFSVEEILRDKEQ